MSAALKADSLPFGRCLVGPVVKASVLRVAGLGSILAFAMDLCPG